MVNLRINEVCNFFRQLLKKSIDITDNHISVLHALFEGKVIIIYLIFFNKSLSDLSLLV